MFDVFFAFFCNIFEVLAPPKCRLNKYLQYGCGHFAQSSISDRFFFRPSAASEFQRRLIFGSISGICDPPDLYHKIDLVLKFLVWAPIPENLDFGTHLNHFFQRNSKTQVY